MTRLGLAASFLLIAQSASAQITGITFSKVDIAGIPLTVTVTGSGKCSVVVDYGDKTIPATGVLNLPLTHTYALDPNKTYPVPYPVKATGPGGMNSCTGNATTSLLVYKFKMPALKPALLDLMPFSQLNPGGFVALKGYALGPWSQADSKLVIRLPSGKTRQMDTPIKWTGELIVAKIPADIEGEVAGSCAFQATTVGGKQSPWFTGKQVQLHCTPTMDFEVLDPAHVTVSHCSDDAGDNKCNDTTSGHANAFTVIANSQPHPGIVTLDTAGTGPSGASIDSRHESDWGLSSDDDTDTYTISLKNGWRVEHVQFNSAQTDNAAVMVTQAIAADVTSGTLTVHYHIGSSGGWVIYGAGIVIRGPKGVPF